ncbi:MAG TPA: hypothetical protein V6D16_18620 [Candidatus Obscuribacterales bacterium]
MVVLKIDAVPERSPQALGAEKGRQQLLTQQLAVSWFTALVSIHHGND